MPTPDYHLRYLRACLENLEDYLLSSMLYWPIGIPSPTGETPYPQMTIGNLLVERALLSALLDGGVDGPLAEVDFALERVKAKWRVAWEKKLDAEIPSRMRQWQEWLNEETPQSSLAPGHYRNGVRLRLMLDLLAGEDAPASQSMQAQLQILDGKLRRSVRSGEFIWNKAYKNGFPQDTFWYLYVEL